MGKIIKYWQKIKYTKKWQILYRKTKEKNILDNSDEPFQSLLLPKRKWAADPLLYEFEGNVYLFFELFDEKKNKGVIAVSKYDGTSFSKYKIVIEEDFHLSFPFVFDLNGKIYMIPETSKINSVVLYRAISFPFEWTKEKNILEGINACDNIIWKHHNSLFLFSSIMDGCPSKCFNKIYLLDENALEIEFEFQQSISSNIGIRNGGQIVKLNGEYYRVGQYCPNNNYGIGLIFYKIELKNNTIMETPYKMITINDLFLNEKRFSGIHTYSFSNNIECVDVRIDIKRNIFERIMLLFKRVISRK